MNSMTTTKDLKLEVLRKAEELVDHGWTQGVYVRDPAGCAINYRSSSACKFCLDGALIKATYIVIGENRFTYENMLKGVRKLVASWLLGWSNQDEDANKITMFNDHIITNQSDVMEVLQKTIEKVENE